jgi:radical SAM superfamily enzyme YgiQ (UPF0313 family)
MTSYQLPLGLGYISASLKRAGYDVMVLNPNHSREDLPVLLERAIGDFSPDVIAAGGMAFHLVQVGEIAALARRLAPHSIIVIGGLLVTNQPEVAMTAIPQADFGVVGEGEQTIVELVGALGAGANPDIIRGLIYRQRDSGTFKLTDPRPMQENMDVNPWIDFDGLGLDIYAGLHQPGEVAPGLIVDTGARVLPFLTSRGCPFPCTFCCHEATGRRYRTRSIDDVFAELETAIDRFSINTLVIYDDLFCLKRQRLEEFCERIMPLGLRWQCSIRVEQVRPETLRLMRDSGCVSIGFGVESMSPTVLASMKKSTTREALDGALKQIYEAHITPWANLIFGDPAETWETAMESLDWWEKNNRYDLRTAFIGYHPGSQIYEEALRTGLIGDPVAFLLSGNAEINATRMTDDDYAALKQHVSMFVRTFSFCGRIVDWTSEAQGCYDVATACPHCEAINRHGRIGLSRNILIRVSCRHCGQLYRLPVVLRPAPTEELIRLVGEMNGLIEMDPDPEANADVEKIFWAAWRALELDGSQEHLWELVIDISDQLGDTGQAVELLRHQIYANPFQPILFEQMHARLTDLGDLVEAARFARQASHLRAVGVLGPTYYT